MSVAQKHYIWGGVFGRQPADQEPMFWHTFDGCARNAMEERSVLVADGMEAANLIGIVTTAAELDARFVGILSGAIKPTPYPPRSNVVPIAAAKAQKKPAATPKPNATKQAKPTTPARVQPKTAHDAQIVPNDAWRESLRHNQAGQTTKDVGNVALFLTHAPGFHKTLCYDKMSHNIYWERVPDYKLHLSPPLATETLADHDAVYVQQVLAKYFMLSVGKDIVWSAMEKAAHENAKHPVQDYLNGLKPWDGIERIDKWLHSYIGCDDTKYNSKIGRWFLISAVARGMRPGCQADHVLILEGKQGKGKSQAVKALGSPWTLENLPDIRDAKAAAEVIGDRWLVEIAELDAFKGAGMTRIKSFVTQQFDDFRPAYAKAKVRRPRSCVFIATTNEHAYLDDPTGARRFWPVECKGNINLKALKQDRDQLWAEALAEFNKGEQWHPDETLTAELQKQQEARRVHHPWEDLVALYVEGRDEITTEELFRLCLGIVEVAKRTTQNAKDLAKIMRGLGYVEAKVWVVVEGEDKERRGWAKLDP